MTATEYSRERRAKFKAMGMCAVCGKAAPITGKSMCKECAARQSEASEREKEKKRRWAAHGICTTCGIRMAGDGHAQCPVCRARKRAKYAELQERRSAEKKAQEQGTEASSAGSVKGSAKSAPPNYSFIWRELQKEFRETMAL